MNPISSTLAVTALGVAKTQVGVQEKPKGSNAGPEVELYLESVNLGKGYAWCMAFVYWNFQQAALRLAVKNPVVKSAGVLNCYNLAKSYRVATPQAGDVFIMQFSGGTGHTGFVENVIGNNIYTIEGNTNADGSREGYEVARRVRSIKSCKSFLRY